MGLVVVAAALLSPPAPGSFNDEVNTLVEIKKALNDPSGVLPAWDPAVIAAGDELCDWPMVVCNGKDQVFRLDLSNQNLSGTLSPVIGNLRSMRNLDLSFNNLSGPLPIFRASIVSFRGNPLLNPTAQEPHDFPTPKPANSEGCS
ncbi:unnamed protein product [Miscanthus lutarioriparius]|uniref:Leucine-rich repeat-containing N-terminal plant-type domain-containing protein n=1 Tax=Miscanthus lutarioriparius TaxID=422564 RepID=A0A811RZC6_9POAL|nr:unnamed protein product [Miscanthus lutarioriparius]